ncbi:LamG-like jellyroll fold domain-containing protein [Hymenobacter sp. B81]|uniref:LamG-like jellyroll fold domain-containing protein n=1 Tax=Hymenobacter sp. B81 TaxID=3344878 RepID=UPI0037DC5B61
MNLKSYILGLLLTGSVGATQAQRLTALEFTPLELDRVSVPLAMPATGSLTLEAWVNYTGLVYQGTHNTILEFGDDQSWFGVTTNGELSMYGAVAGGSVPRLVWTHVAYTWDGVTSRLYINGNPVPTTSTLAPERGGTALGIGYHEGDTGWDGYIADVMVWNTARSGAQIQADRQLFQGPLSALPTSTTGLLAYFKLAQVSGQTVPNAVVGGPAGVLGTSLAAEPSDPRVVNLLPNSTARGRVPAAQALQPPFPNPVTESAELRFWLPTAGPVSLRVFDATGRLVSVLTEGRLPAGDHRPVLRRGPLPAGLYSAVLTTEAGTSRQPLLLAR